MTLRYATILISASLATAAFAQPTLNIGNSVPGAGQTFPVNTADAFISTGPTGNNVAFDYWNMLAPPTGNQNIQYLGTSATSTSTLIPSASLLSTDGGTDTLFWNVTTQGLEMVGSRTAFEGVLDFNDASLELKLPCTIGTTWSDPTGDTYTVSSIPVTRVGTVTGIADAWGTLNLVGGASYPQVLRVHVRRNISDQSAFASTVRISNIHYYYSTTSEFPIVKLVQDSTQVSGGSWAVTKRELYKGNPFIVGMADLDADDIGFTAYPNPTEDLLNVSIGQASPASTRMEVLDPSGRLVLADALRGTNGQLDTSALPAGVYSLRVLSGDRLLGVQRITVL